MKSLLVTILLLLNAWQPAVAQVQWSDTSMPKDVDWNNYSTSYIDPQDDNQNLFLVTAIPYAGKYQVGDLDANAPFDLTYTGSLYQFRSALNNRTRSFNTYDSGEVYFMAPGIHSGNAHKYEYEVLLNGKQVLVPWQTITHFTDSSFQLNLFNKHMAFLGGYKAPWDSYITVALRKTGVDTPLYISNVIWKNIAPVLQNVYTVAEFPDFLNQVTPSAPMEKETPNTRSSRWATTFPFSRTRQKQQEGVFVLHPDESTIIVLLKGVIYKKDALEYELVKNGKVIRAWAPKEYSNSQVLLTDLHYGNYELHLRFSGQRHNVTTFPFKVEPHWYETLFFKMVVALLFLIILGFIYLLWQNVRQRRKFTATVIKKAQLRLKLQSVYAQLNPHFMFNALHSIQGLVNRNDIEAANRYLAEFGKLIRESLATQGKDMIPLSKELDTLDTYLQLEQLRFGFQYSIHKDESIDAFETEIPALLLQPLVENAVKHGISTLQEKGAILIKLEKQQTDMQIIIEDNGTGFDTSQANTAGYGLSLTRERLHLLNEMHPEEPVHLQVSSTPGKGTTVSLSFKKWLA